MAAGPAAALRRFPNDGFLTDGSAMLDKTYRPDAVEPRQYAAWERAGCFAADPRGSKRPYTIMMPPPNVTGSLHMGHALTFTLQDILVRFERMRGRDALWQPGTDHAGIATEIVVGNQLAERQINKQALGREKFVERVWEWKTKGALWHLRYPVEGDPGRFLVVATTRPETMLGDTGVAVHPEDGRYADLVGKSVRLPLVGRLIPIVADEYADPEMGSGAVKITPAHDFNDFEVGRRHGLETINIFDRDAHLNDAVPERYPELERFAARKQVRPDLAAA